MDIIFSYEETEMTVNIVLCVLVKYDLPTQNIEALYKEMPVLV